MVIRLSKQQRIKQRQQRYIWFMLEGPWPCKNILSCTNTLCMSYIPKTFLLVSTRVRSKQLIVFCAWPRPKREQKQTAKNFVTLQNHCPILTMYWVTMFSNYNSLWLLLHYFSLPSKIHKGLDRAFRFK